MLAHQWAIEHPVARTMFNAQMVRDTTVELMSDPTLNDSEITEKLPTEIDNFGPYL